MSAPRLDTEITITDRNCVPVTNPIRYTEIDAEVRFNAVVAGSFVAPAYPELTEALLPSHRVVLRDGGTIFKSGPIEGLDFAHRDRPGRRRQVGGRLRRRRRAPGQPDHLPRPGR
ncbi:hypothetical protein GCM10029963_53150 [Micromonospora andamanensis]